MTPSMILSSLYEPNPNPYLDPNPNPNPLTLTSGEDASFRSEHDLISSGINLYERGVKKKNEIETRAFHERRSRIMKEKEDLTFVPRINREWDVAPRYLSHYENENESSLKKVHVEGRGRDKRSDMSDSLREFIDFEETVVEIGENGEVMITSTPVAGSKHQGYYQDHHLEYQDEAAVMEDELILGDDDAVLENVLDLFSAEIPLPHHDKRAEKGSRWASSLMTTIRTDVEDKLLEEPRLKRKAMTPRQWKEQGLIS